MMRRVAARFTVLLLLCACGCSTTMMKGTPFYTGEYKKRQGPPEDRVNLWPAAYYRKPALSVAWPIAEVTDDHVALRPLFSVYKLDKERHEWNVLWPLVQFDNDTGEHRVFPFFWAEDYFVGFPFFWFGGTVKAVFPVVWWSSGFTVFPLAWYEKGEFCHFWPLWLYTRQDKGHDLHVLWPFLRHTTGEKDSGFDVWPLVGHHSEGEATRSYALWPLVQSQSEKNESSQLAFPFYFREAWKDKDGAESGNLLVLPAVYRHWDKDGKLTVTPLWATAQRKGERWSLLLPLYYRQSNDEKQASQLITPLWSAGREGDSRWSALFPFFYHWADDKKQESQLITPLAMRQQSAKGSSWTVFPLLSDVSWHEGEKDLWFLWPLVHVMWGGKRTSHHVAPLYYYSREGERSSFVTALYARDEWPDRTATCIPALLSNFETNDKTKRKDLTVLAFIGQASWGPDKLRHSVFPLYGYNREKQAFVTPLVSWKTTPGDRFVNLLGPVAHTWTNGKGRRTFHFAWPFTKWAAEKGKGLTYSRIWPLFSREARAKGCDFWLFPWLSIKTREDWSRGSFFPLWSYGRKVQSKEGLTDTDFSLLGWLYDYQFRGGRYPKDKPEEKEDYTRARVLWRLYHYERVNDDQSLDVFPFITWDKKADGRGQFSFFWRLFRTARTANGGRKLDVLFIPLIRKAGTKPAA